MLVDHEALADLLEHVREWSGKHVRSESIEEAEAAGVEIGRLVGQVVAEEGAAQTAQASYEGASRACDCGRRAKFMGHRVKPFVTLAQRIRVARPYYYCKHCGTGVFPWDVQQGLGERCYTPGVKGMVSRVSARLPYGHAVELIQELTGLKIEESSAEWMVSEVGGRLRQFEAELQARYVDEQATPPRGPVMNRLYVAMDGSFAHIDDGWHEVKTGVVYEAVVGKHGRDRSGVKRYVSAQESAQEFGDRLYSVAVEEGIDRAKEVVVLGDGAEWIWNLADRHYPDATQIVDYWHACQHIWEVAHLQYGEASELGQRWAQDHCRRLKREGPQPLLTALRRMKPSKRKAAKKISAEIGYFARNRHRMQYPTHRARGLMIGSGPAEAACKLVVGQRLKGPGMRWKPPGADAVLAVRCAVLNHDSDLINRAARAA